MKLINILRDLFVSYGVAEELSSDGGPQFKAHQLNAFLQLWGVKHRKSSVDYPQSNGRAESAVKSAKRIIHNNISPDGSLNNNKAARAILQHRNTPLPGLNLSPAQILLHRQLRDSVPAHPSHYQVHKEWVISAEDREKAFTKQNKLMVDKYNSHAKSLPPFTVGTDVILQGPNKKWDRAGKIVEVLPFRQYRVRMFSSGRVTLRNRRFLRKSVTPTLLPSAARLPHQINADEAKADTAMLPNQPEPDMPQTPLRERTVPRALKCLQSFNQPGLKE